MTDTFNADRGKPLPFGASRTMTGYNFALYSRHASAVSLLVFCERRMAPDHEIVLDPKRNRTGDVWHIHLQNLPDHFYYMYRIDGPWQPEKGLVFNADLLLLDPYAKSIIGLENWGERDPHLTQSLASVENAEYDWQDDRPPNTPLSDTIIYEMHVRGFSRHDSASVTYPGTYHAIIEKIGHLKQLGITAIELLPVHEFDERDCRYSNPSSGESLLNYWGYSTLGFFALKSGYAAADSGQAAVNEFRDLVRALHAENLEIILDVVFNHTAEGDRNCPVLSFKGIANNTYYLLDDSGDYQNHSGCGNTMNGNHPVVMQLILDVLRYWVVEMHVDGFRFDLASILTRDQSGNVLARPPLLEAIAKDPVLSGAKIIAEAWDASGLYQVGSFPAFQRWAEWNGCYRDSMRQFAMGKPGLTGEIATRIAGSEDLYRHSGRRPYHSINFITSHDGFTMMDLVSYEKKYNQVNGQHNEDGENHNFSLNFGVEGPTADPQIQARRKQQIRNLATLLMLSQGTPMMLAGDEFGNTQFGNNNAWCQDNEISWLDWGLLERHRDLFDFWRKLIEFRKKHPILRRKGFFSGQISPVSGLADISWHNTRQGQPDFDRPSRSLAFMIDGGPHDNTLYAAINFNDSDLSFELPSFDTDGNWKQVLSTHDADGFLKDTWRPIPREQRYLAVAAFSITVLLR